MVLTHYLWHTSLKMSGEYEENDGEREDQSVDEGNRDSHERWSSHFAKDSMSWTTWAEKQKWPRAQLKRN